MFGTNPLRKQELTPDTLRIESIFATAQGEGPLSGRPAVFVRLSGCNLKCFWCDTEFESGIDNVRSAEEVCAAVIALFPNQLKFRRLVVLTGGEPLRQNVVRLCYLLRDASVHVQIETAGTLWVPGLEHLIRAPMEPGVSIVVSPKTGKVVQEVARHAMAWKYIINSDDEFDLVDGLPMTGTQSKIPIRQKLARPPEFVRADQIFLSPCDVYDETRNKANRNLVAQLSLKHGYTLSLQVHKILELP